MSLNPEKHDAMRVWAALPENSFKDPEELIIRQKGSIIYKNRSCLKAYKRIEAIYDEFLRDQNAKKLKDLHGADCHA